jgi:histone H2A
MSKVVTKASAKPVATNKPVATKSVKKRHNLVGSRGQRSYETYITKVLKQVCPDNGIASDALSTLNNLLYFTLTQISNNVNVILRNSSRAIVSPADISTGIKLTFPDPLALGAIAAGDKAVNDHKTFVQSHGTEKVSKATRAGLILSIKRTSDAMMLHLCVHKKSAAAPIRLAAALEFLLRYVLSAAKGIAQEQKVRRITPRHLYIVVENSPSLKALFANVIFAGGVLPHVPVDLIKKKTKRSKKVASA